MRAANFRKRPNIHMISVEKLHVGRADPLARGLERRLGVKTQGQFQFQVTVPVVSNKCKVQIWNLSDEDILLSD